MEIPQIERAWKYKIAQTSKGTMVTVHGDEILKVIEEYTFLRTELAKAGFRIAKEEE
jgi:hypothetical protein